jgi:hypothetical protein
VVALERRSGEPCTRRRKVYIQRQRAGRLVSGCGGGEGEGFLRRGNGRKRAQRGEAANEQVDNFTPAVSILSMYGKMVQFVFVLVSVGAPIRSL